jgi:hypothetical protein
MSEIIMNLSLVAMQRVTPSMKISLSLEEITDEKRPSGIFETNRGRIAGPYGWRRGNGYNLDDLASKSRRR